MSPRPATFAIALALALAPCASPALADAPLGPPVATSCSLSGRFCATRKQGRGVLVWRKERGGARRPLWRAPVRTSVMQVADDGLSLVVLYPGSNLLALDAGPGTVVLTFHRPGMPSAPVTLAQVVRDPARLPRTVSHRQWASAYGYNERGAFELLTAEGRRILFDPRTGRPALR